MIAFPACYGLKGNGDMGVTFTQEHGMDGSAIEAVQIWERAAIKLAVVVTGSIATFVPHPESPEIRHPAVPRQRRRLPDSDFASRGPRTFVV